MSEDNNNYWDEIEEKLRLIEQERQREKEELEKRRENRRKKRKSYPREEDFTRELLRMKEEEEAHAATPPLSPPSEAPEKTPDPSPTAPAPEHETKPEKTVLEDREMEETLAKLWDESLAEAAEPEKAAPFGGRFLKRKFKKEPKDPLAQTKRPAAPESESTAAEVNMTAADVAIEPKKDADSGKSRPERRRESAPPLTAEEQAEAERLRRAAEIEKRWTQKLDFRDIEEAERKRTEKLEVDHYQLAGSRADKEPAQPEAADRPAIPSQKPISPPGEDEEERRQRAAEIEKRWTQKLTLEDIQAADASRRAELDSQNTDEGRGKPRPLTEPYIRPKIKKEPVIPMTLPPKEKTVPEPEQPAALEEDLWMFKTPPEIKKETLTEELAGGTETDEHLDLVWNVETVKKPAATDPVPEMTWTVEEPKPPAPAEPPEATGSSELPAMPELPELPAQSDDQLDGLGRGESPPVTTFTKAPAVDQAAAANQPEVATVAEELPPDPYLPDLSADEADAPVDLDEPVVPIVSRSRGQHQDIDKSLPFEKQMKLRHQRWTLKKSKWGEWAARRLAVWSRREKAFSQKVAVVVQRLDIRIEKFLRLTDLLYGRVENFFFAILDYAERHKMRLLAVFIGLVICAVGVTVFLGSITAYEYIYNGKVLGIVKDQDDVYTTIDVIGTKLGDTYETTIEIDKERDITFNMVRGLDLEYDGKEEILNKLTYMKDIKAIGYAIYVGTEEIAVLQNETVANGILDKIKSQYIKTDDSVDYVGEATFAEDVRVQEVDILLGDIERDDEVLEYMLTGAVEKQIHEVQKGQTFSEVASLNGLSQEELLAMNPGINPEKLQIGQEIILTSDSPIVTVQTTEVATYDMPIAYETVYQDDSSLYKDEQRTLVAGISGVDEVVARIVRHNGHEVDRQEISRVTLSEPVDALVAVGTKERPALAGTGSFKYPIKTYRISSGYGRRWGRMHNGTDFAASTGTPIYAADGGTVTFAGYKGSFGYLVIINHGGGKETYYAHCSKLYVSTGTKVYQGQHIANVGNTGNSTGPHLHFEVHVNGVAKNPMSYL